MSEISNLKSKPTPVLVGNGDICLMPDEEGTLYESPEYAQARKTSKIPIKSIYRAGRRMYINPHKKIQGNLLPFGHFSFDCGSNITSSRLNSRTVLSRARADMKTVHILIRRTLFITAKIYMYFGKYTTEKQKKYHMNLFRILKIDLSRQHFAQI